MKSAIKNLLNKIRRYLSHDISERLFESTSETKMLLGKILISNLSNAKSINEAEFSVFSQFGDDGIIQYLLKHINIENKTFVEFGVENYRQANTRFLLMNNNWSGLVMDSSKNNIDLIKKENISWQYHLKAKSSFITAENINDLISEEGTTGNIGFLHIDIDGNEYWVWKALAVIMPDIVSIEYNSLFGKNKAVTIPYQQDFKRTKAHFSNLYAGASLLALSDLAYEKGYYLVGCNSAGNDAYFVNKNIIGNLSIAVPEKAFAESKFRESRNEQGELTYLSGDERLQLIKGLPVYNTRTNQTEKL